MSFGTFIETIKTKLKEILGGKVASPAPKKGKKDKKKPASKMKKEIKGKKPAKTVPKPKAKK